MNESKMMNKSVKKYEFELKKNEILSTTEYGINFTSAVSKDNLVAVQFHPEKSSKSGLQLLDNFVNWDGII